MGRLARSSIALTLVALTALVSVPAHADTTDTDVTESSSSAARESVTVTVPVHTTSGMRALTGKAGSIEIQVGDSHPFRVAVDTGFTGLLLFPGADLGRVLSALPPDSRVATTLSNGWKVKGLPGKATLTISGVQSVTPVPFLYTTSSSPFFNALRSTGVHGLLGIGLKGSSVMTNPLQAMPGELGVRWSMHYSRNNARKGKDAGVIVLGALPPTDPTMVFEMPANGTDANGANLWDDHSVNACWTFGRLDEMCLPTTFDSEFTVLRATGVSGRGLQTDADGDFRYGTPVKLAAPGSAFTGWSYRSGQRASDTRTQAFKHGKPAVNTGNAPFFDFTITYNTVTGRLYLSDPVRKAA